MEEWIGQLWHKVITRASRSDFPAAAVTLESVRRPVGVLFRALGGDGGLRIEAATETAWQARRGLLKRMAGTGQHIQLAWRDDETLRLPPRIAWFPDSNLNRQLYLWLAALAAHRTDSGGDWLQRNAAAVAGLLRRHPGLKRRYRRLMSQHLRQRPDPASLSADEAAQELAIRAALQSPQWVTAALPEAAVAPWPVPLWLHPDPPPQAAATPRGNDHDDGAGNRDRSEQAASEQRHRGERVETPDGRSGLLAFRLESLFTRAEYVGVDRTTDDDMDTDAQSALEDMDIVSVAQDRGRTASRLRFDLDLPPEDNDDLRLGDGIPLPEWDFRSQTLQPDHCRLQPMLARHAGPEPLPAHLHVQARRLRRLFEMFQPERRWQRAQMDGSEPDLDALIQHHADALRGVHPGEAPLYRRLGSGGRELACLLLADLSLSTDAWVSDSQRIIDVIRDSLLLFTEALQVTGDRFAMYGFSSRRRDHVRYHRLKAFDEACSDTIRGRIQAIRPGYYTRMGAAIRHSTRLLEQQPGHQKLLLILTDGKPNDLDKYEGRYGVEDTHMAVRDAASRGVRPFCLTIDEKGGDYLPYLFGNQSWILLRQAVDLPDKLPLLYARLTNAI